MALIRCTACCAKISDQAATCPNCTHPIAHPEPISFYLTERVALKQKTSKVCMAAQLIGLLLICAGPVACMAGGYSTTAELFVLGFVLWIGGRMGAWWANG